LANAPLVRLPASEAPLRIVLTVPSAAPSGHPHFTTQTGAMVAYDLGLGGISLRFPSDGCLVIPPSRTGGILTLSTSATVPTEAREWVALTLRVN
jgi:hypothetical protein